MIPRNPATPFVDKRDAKFRGLTDYGSGIHSATAGLSRGDARLAGGQCAGTATAVFDTAEGFAQHRQWEATLNEGRWGMVTWPEELGGRGCDLIDWLIFEEEYYRVRAPLRVNQNGIFLLGPTLMEYGTQEQKARILPKMASGEEVWAQGWSEPNAGSDMAAIRCPG